METERTVPFRQFILVLSGILLFFPMLEIRAAAGPGPGITNSIDLLAAALFFIACTIASGLMRRPVALSALAPLGLLLLFLFDGDSFPGLMSGDQESLRNAFLVGAALYALALALALDTAALLQIHGDTEPLCRKANSLLATRPYLALFIVTATILFLEIVLIRYAASQIRIFSFYKNVPLIAAFLGLGLGCFRAGGSRSHILLFLLMLAPVLAILSQITLFFDTQLSRMTAIASSEFVLGDVLVVSSSLWQQITAQIYTVIFIVLVFLMIAGLFSFLGRFLGDALEQVARLRGYTVDICGSLFGIFLFTGLGTTWAPPPAWIGLGILGLALIVPRDRAMLRLLPIAAFCVFAVSPSIGETVWSPYQKIIGQKVADGFNLKISDVYFQRARHFKPYDQVSEAEIRQSRYYLTFWKRENLDRVLIVGAGSGNETALALLAGAKRVDAVEIDPAIVDFGRRYHPNRPYSDPRVRVIVNDARKAFRGLEKGSYDMVVFGALDAHTQLGHSSVRLDNYVFTVESIRDATRLVRPGGSVVISAAAPTGWLQQRFVDLLRAGCGPEVKSTIFQRQSIHATCRVGNKAPSAKASLAASGRVLPVDDWPFIYLPKPNVPMAYALAILILALVSVMFLRAGGMEVRMADAFRGHMFFLGAGFLLMEVYAINRLALLFGTTWIVSAVAIGLVLALIVLANLTTGLVRRDLRFPAYAGLFASLALSYSLDMSTALDQGPLVTGLVSLVIVSPVYFAGIIFATSYAGSDVAGTSIGANILGAVVGGWFEYMTMATGIRSMTLFAAIFYAGSLLCLAWHHRRTSRAAAPVRRAPAASP